MIRAILISFVMGVVFSQDITRFAQTSADSAMQQLKADLNVDAYDKICRALRAS
jgi:hypothetical protein